MEEQSYQSGLSIDRGSQVNLDISPVIQDLDRDSTTQNERNLTIDPFNPNKNKIIQGSGGQMAHHIYHSSSESNSSESKTLPLKERKLRQLKSLF